MFRIRLMSRSVKMSLTASSPQPEKSYFMRADTGASCRRGKCGVITFALTASGSQSSPQILIEELSLTLHLLCRLIISLVSTMLLQIKYGFPHFLAVRMEQSRKYLALKTLATREGGFCKILQVCLDIMAKLKSRRFLKFRPPSS